MNEYAEKILFNRASLSSWCRMFDIENGKQNLKMLRLLNFEILKTVLLIWALKQIILMLRSPSKTNLDAHSKAYCMLADLYA